MQRACFTSRRQAIERRAPEQHGVRAERQRFHDVGAAAETAGWSSTMRTRLRILFLFWLMVPYSVGDT